MSEMVLKSEAAVVGGSRRFVAVFVLITVVTLLGYHYSLRTSAMDWYLFQIARHTSWVLGKIGHSSSVENIHAYWGREAGMTNLAAQKAPLVTFVYDPGVGERMNYELGMMNPEGKPAPTVSSFIRSKNSPPGSGAPIEFRFQVAPECSAIPSMVIYLAAVLAFPARWRARLIGILAGIPLLYIVNILRLACLAVIGAFTEGGPWFKFSHEYVWQGIYVVFIVAAWMLWVEFVVKRRPA